MYFGSDESKSKRLVVSVPELAVVEPPWMYADVVACPASR
jgi:hypothetical protein